MPDRGISFLKVIGDAVKKSHDRSELYAVVHRELQGKTRDEAREILIRETRRVGGEPMGQPFLDRQLDTILAPDTPVEKARQYVDGIGTAVNAGTYFVNVLRSPGADHADFTDRPDVQFTGDLHRPCQVLLSDGVEDWIGTIPSVGSISYRDLSSIKVKLTCSPRRVDGGEITATVDGRKVGILDPGHAEPFGDLLEGKGSEPGDVAGAGAIRSLDQDGIWRLDLGAPQKIIRSLKWQEPDPG